MSRVAITLCQHAESPHALLLSLGGRNPVWIPKSLVTEPAALQAVSLPHGKFWRGRFAVEAWKLRELGLDGHAGDDQMEML